MTYKFFFFFQAEDGIRDIGVTGVQTSALPICEIYKENEDPPNVNFKYIDNRKLNGEIGKVNSILEKIKTNDITSTNRLLVACTRLITERLWMKEGEKKRMETPRWKRRLEQDVAELRRSLIKLERKHQGEQRSNQGIDRKSVV